VPELPWTMIFLFAFSCIVGITGTYHHAQLFSIEMGSCKLTLPWLVLNHDSPDLSLSSGQGYRCEPLVPGYESHFNHLLGVSHQGSTKSHVLNTCFLRDKKMDLPCLFFSFNSFPSSGIENVQNFSFHVSIFLDHFNKNTKTW
jgi:hypothetical protein